MLTFLAAHVVLISQAFSKSCKNTEKVTFCEDKNTLLLKSLFIQTYRSLVCKGSATELDEMVAKLKAIRIDLKIYKWVRYLELLFSCPVYGVLVFLDHVLTLRIKRK